MSAEVTYASPVGEEVCEHCQEPIEWHQSHDVWIHAGSGEERCGPKRVVHSGESERAQHERAAQRTKAEDRGTPHAEAVAAYLIGHVRIDAGGGCSCGVRGELGQSYELHRGDGILALLRRRGWQG